MTAKPGGDHGRRIVTASPDWAARRSVPINLPSTGTIDSPTMMGFGHWGGGGDMTQGGSRRLPGSGRPRRKPRRCRYDSSIVTRAGQEKGKFFCHECRRVLEYSETKRL